jgi:hypothetical protein
MDDNILKKISEFLDSIYNEQRIDDRIMASSSAADEFNVVDKIRGIPKKKPQDKMEPEDENTNYLDSIVNLSTGKEVNND